MSIHDRYWEERPTDVANLLNPAFVGAVIYSAVGAYDKVVSSAMPFEFAFLVLPLVLHEPTRRHLPRSARTMMQTWLQENRECLLGFPNRTRELVPFGREAILFAHQRNTLSFSDKGELLVGKQKLKGLELYLKDKNEVAEILKKAEIVGSWLASAGNPTTVYAMLGIRP